MTNDVSQQGAKARGNIVGRDKIETHYHPPAAKQSIVEQLLEKLQAEVLKNEKVRHTVEALAHFQCRRSHDGIDGLEAKLKAGQRTDEYLSAIEKKELFVKLLERWSLYARPRDFRLSPGSGGAPIQLLHSSANH